MSTWRCYLWQRSDYKKDHTIMLTATVKKLWRGCITLREQWVKLGIKHGGLIVELKIRGKSKGKMRIPVSTLEKALQSYSITVNSKIDGQPYQLYDIYWCPIDERQNELFKG